MAYLALQKGELVLGFNPQQLLERTDHKLIRHFEPPAPPTRLPEDALRRLMHEAVMVNDSLAPKRVKKRS